MIPFYTNINKAGGITLFDTNVVYSKKVYSKIATKDDEYDIYSFLFIMSNTAHY